MTLGRGFVIYSLSAHGLGFSDYEIINSKSVRKVTEIFIYRDSEIYKGNIEYFIFPLEILLMSFSGEIGIYRIIESCKRPYEYIISETETNYYDRFCIVFSLVSHPIVQNKDVHENWIILLV